MKRDYRTQNVCVRQSRFIFMVSIHSFYTNDRGSCEIDFLVDNGETVVPLEVKEELNLPLFAVGEMEGVIRENRKYKDKEGLM